MTLEGSRRCLITGANRGIGLEFARQLVAGGAFVVGTRRTPETADDLRELLCRGSGGESVRAMLALTRPLRREDSGAIFDHDELVAAEARER